MLNALPYSTLWNYRAWDRHKLDAGLCPVEAGFGHFYFFSQLWIFAGHHIWGEGVALPCPCLNAPDTGHAQPWVLVGCFYLQSYGVWPYPPHLSSGSENVDCCTDQDRKEWKGNWNTRIKKNDFKFFKKMAELLRRHGFWKQNIRIERSFRQRRARFGTITPNFWFISQ